VRSEIQGRVSDLERRAVEAALAQYFASEAVRPNPWMLAGRATALGLGALQIRHSARNPWDARFHPFSPTAPESTSGRGDTR
jgi:hypothetical protein